MKQFAVLARRISAIGCAGIMAIGMCLPAAAAEREMTTKEETIYVQADTSGQAEQITVETALRNLPNSDSVIDKTILTDIKNSEGDEEFTYKSDGTLVWENHGEDIAYEGTYSGDLPVGVQVSYTLDGKTCSGESLAGKNGHITIRFDYENSAVQTVQSEDGTEHTVRVPFMAMSLAVLDEESFSNIEVENGKLIQMGDTSIAVGMAFPGLRESLELDSYDKIDLEIPSYVEISADVTDFELDFTATIFSSGLFSDLELDDLKDVDDLIEGIDELADASGELVSGTAAFEDGLGEFQSYLAQYLTGGGALAEGAAQISGGLTALDNQSAALTDGIAALTNGLTQMKDVLGNINLTELGDEDYSSVTLAAEKLMEDMTQLQMLLGQLQSAAELMEAYELQVQAQTAAAQSALNEIDLTDQTELARQQILEAGRSALAEQGLSEVQQEEILSRITENVDLSSANASVQTGISAAKAALEQMPELGTIDFSDMTDSVQELVNDLITQMNTISAHVQGISVSMQNLSVLPGMLEQLQTGTQSLLDGSQQLNSGLLSYTDAVQKLSSGANQLADGAATLSEAGSALSDGFSALKDGSSELADGMKAFDQDGIQELKKLADDDLKRLTDRLKAVQQADQSYINFAGINPDMTGSVRFLFETEEIKT